MISRIDARLQDLELTLPEAPNPVANYAPFIRTGALVFVSGQIARSGDESYTGKVGAEVSIETGQAAARVCALNLLAQLRAACDGDLDRVTHVVKLTVFVNAAPDFKDHPKVANGASDLMVEVFGDIGRHSRAAVGCGSLPGDVSVEVEGIFEIR